MAKYKMGDVVQLKSGGPEMTVASVSKLMGTSYECQWFSGKKLERGNFPEDSLQNPPARTGPIMVSMRPRRY